MLTTASIHRAVHKICGEAPASLALPHPQSEGAVGSLAARAISPTGSSARPPK